MDKLIDKIIKTQNPTALGLDTRLEYIPQSMLQGPCLTFEQAAGAIYDFNKALIDATYDIIPCAKVQIAYYEMYSTPGLVAFYKTVEYAKSKGMYVIADVKRNDIGSTAEAYSNAYLGTTALSEGAQRAFDCDCVTVNGYLGTDGVQPFLDDCKNNGKDIFVLVKTSNPSSGELQDLTLADGRKVYEAMADMVIKWGSYIGEYGYSDVGAVVGATYKETAQSLRNRMKNTFFLIPGYGAQGGKAEDVAVSFDKRGLGGVVNASRSLLCAYKKEIYKEMSPAEATRAEALAMQADIVNALKREGKWEL